jgi:hypothetical protein
MSTNKTSILEAAIALSQTETVEIERVGAATGVKLVLDCARSNKHFQVFRGCSGADSAVAEVECRTSRADAGSKGTLIYLALNESQAPGASEIVARLGTPKSVEVPLQKAGAAGSAIYVYQIAGGELRFAVRTGAPERVLSIAIDRTSLAPRVRVRNRLAKWGKADLTPFTA